MVTVHKWGRVSLGRTAPAETARRYKTNWRSVLREREVRAERKRKRKKAREKKEKRREQEAGVSTQKEKKKASVWVSDQRQQRDNSSFPVLEQASVWCRCVCEQHRWRVRHGSVTNK